MGTIVSRRRVANDAGNTDSTDPSNGKGPTQWKVIEKMEKMEQRFNMEGTLPTDTTPDMVELRALLDDHIGQKYIGAYARKVFTHENFFCWIDIQEFRNIPTADYQRSKAAHIFHKYVKTGAVLQLGGITLEQQEAIKTKVESHDKSMITSDMFNGIQMHCFKALSVNLYGRFKETPEYVEMKSKVSSSYNRVEPDDFEYVDGLGEGGFGKVVHAVKKSTGTHYAMKIQLKVALLDTFSDDPTRIDHERRVFAKTHHPFIVGMDYAFQTPEFAIMALDLVSAGDLQQAINHSKDKRLDEARVQFYSAEIILALSHLHDLGLMYRDLKPCNVLLGHDGHIKLVDMGGVAEFAENTILKAGDAKLVSYSPYGVEIGDLVTAAPNKPPAVARECSKGSHEVGSEAPVKDEGEEDSQTYTEEKRKKRETSIDGDTTDYDDMDKLNRNLRSGGMTLPGQHRRRSIMGTQGYMAPEMAVLLNQPRSVRVGYSHAVDYWSLGVTVYKLLTGGRPFSRRAFDKFLEDKRSRMGKGQAKYAEMLAGVHYPSYISESGRHLINGLLDGDETRRLGCTPALLDELKSHPFFKDIDWLLLAQRHMIPPVIPKVPPLATAPNFKTFKALMDSYINKSELEAEMYQDQYDWRQAPAPQDQKAFAEWDYVSMHTLKIEMGVAHEMDAFDSSFKVRKLLGSSDEAPPKNQVNRGASFMGMGRSAYSLATNAGS